MQGTPLIEVRSAGKNFLSRSGVATRALGDVTFSVPEGQFTSILGPSGCGKSTLLRAIAGLERVDSGVVLIRGQAVTAPRRDVGLVFQTAVLLPWRTTLKNVTLPAEIQGLDKASSRYRAEGLLDSVGLGGFEDRYPFELSGGMQQRAAIARALLTDPAVLLMDEPFGALDAITREAMALDLQQLWAATQKTVVFVTHSIQEATFLSDEVIVLSPRPATVSGVVPIELERPRTLALMATPEFGRFEGQLRGLLNEGAPGRAAGAEVGRRDNHHGSGGGGIGA